MRNKACRKSESRIGWMVGLAFHKLKGRKFQLKSTEMSISKMTKTDSEFGDHKRLEWT